MCYIVPLPTPAHFLRSPQYGWTALHEAAGAGHVQAVSVLAGDFGADVEATNKIGWTPLQWASSMGQVDTVRLLVEVFNAEHAASNKFGESAHDMAQRTNNGGTAAYLASAGT